MFGLLLLWVGESRFVWDCVLVRSVGLMYCATVVGSIKMDGRQ